MHFLRLCQNHEVTRDPFQTILLFDALVILPALIDMSGSALWHWGCSCGSPYIFSALQASVPLRVSLGQTMLDLKSILGTFLDWSLNDAVWHRKAVLPEFRILGNAGLHRST